MAINNDFDKGGTAAYPCARCETLDAKCREQAAVLREAQEKLETIRVSLATVRHLGKEHNVISFSDLCETDAELLDLLARIDSVLEGK